MSENDFSCTDIESIGTQLTAVLRSTRGTEYREATPYNADGEDPDPAGRRRVGPSVPGGRPDIPHMLKELSAEWTGRRACVFVCRPPSMRVDTSNAVADLQKLVLKKDGLDEVYLHSENCAI